jgi:hypothetical protein
MNEPIQAFWFCIHLAFPFEGHCEPVQNLQECADQIGMKQWRDSLRWCELRVGGKRIPVVSTMFGGWVTSIKREKK